MKKKMEDFDEKFKDIGVNLKDSSQFEDEIQKDCLIQKLLKQQKNTNKISQNELALKNKKERIKKEQSCKKKMNYQIKLKVMQSEERQSNDVNYSIKNNFNSDSNNSSFFTTCVESNIKNKKYNKESMKLNYKLKQIEEMFL